jgi:superfamily II DNA/RNA helicase
VTQIRDEARIFAETSGLGAVCLYGGVQRSQQVRRGPFCVIVYPCMWQFTPFGGWSGRRCQVRDVQDIQPHIIIATPGRLLDMANGGDAPRPGPLGAFQRP